MASSSIFPGWLSDLLGLSGLAGFVLSILNFRRDRAQIEISVSFNMITVGTARWTTIVTVRNVGRRPVHVSHVSLTRARFWRIGSKIPTVVANDGIKGETLAEGGAPWRVPLVQRGDAFMRLTKLGYVRAHVIAAGRVVHSAAVRVPDVVEEFKDA